MSDDRGRKRNDTIISDFARVISGAFVETNDTFSRSIHSIPVCQPLVPEVHTLHT
jgi:hypothetical protein